MIAKKIYEAIQSGIREAGREENLKPLAEELVSDITSRTVQGKEVKGKHFGRTGKFKKLSENTIKQRRVKATDPRTTAATSNQIMTGSMLNGLKYNIKRNNIEITVDDKTKLGYNQKQGRNFLRLSVKNRDQIKERVVSFIVNKILKSF